MFDEQLAQLVHENVPKKAQEIAKEIATEAYQTSISRRADTPFGRNALNDGLLFDSGKPDDITVLVAKYYDVLAKL